MLLLEMDFSPIHVISPIIQLTYKQFVKIIFII